MTRTHIIPYNLCFQYPVSDTDIFTVSYSIPIDALFQTAYQDHLEGRVLCMYAPCCSLHPFLSLEDTLPNSTANMLSHQLDKSPPHCLSSNQSRKLISFSELVREETIICKALNVFLHEQSRVFYKIT